MRILGRGTEDKITETLRDLKYYARNPLGLLSDLMLRDYLMAHFPPRNGESGVADRESLFQEGWLERRLAGLDKARTPRHVAISVDGSGRWGVRHAGRRLEGYPAGTAALPSLLEAAARAGVEVVTLHLFSTENWKRPDDEVNFLMRFFADAFRAQVPAAIENGYRVRFVGRSAGLPPELVQVMREVEELTRGGERLSVYAAVNYGGQAEILDAARRIAEDGISPQELDKTTFTSYLHAPEMPEVDLFVRPGGELRTSNFLPWHMAFAELYFTDVFWPDFSVTDLLDALEAYTRRSRRLGGLEG